MKKDNNGQRGAKFLHLSCEFLWKPPGSAITPADLQLYPTVAGAVVPIYNLNGVTDLVLSLEPREGGPGFCSSA